MDKEKLAKLKGAPTKEQIETMRTKLAKRKKGPTKGRIHTEIASAYKDEKTVDGLLRLLEERGVLQVPKQRVEQFIKEQEAIAKQLEKDLTKVYYDKNVSTNSIRKLYEA